LAEYQHVVSLRTLGFSQTAIADQVGVAHSTVSRWLSDGAFPEQKPRRRKMERDSHMPSLRERWEAGCHNIAQLYRELVARGYTHSYWSVYEQLLRFFPAGRKNPQTPDQLARPPVLARHAVFLFLRRPTEELSLEEQETLEFLRSLHPDVNQAYALVQQFVHMLRTRTGEQLDTWLKHVRTSQIHELQSLVVRIGRDKAAGVAGLTLTQNNGLVEGKVNKLKLLKRMMYSRAEFPRLASTRAACILSKSIPYTLIVISLIYLSYVIENHLFLHGKRISLISFFSKEEGANMMIALICSFCLFSCDTSKRASSREREIHSSDLPTGCATR
jgi:transcriptional regulator with XRE-family HTH domain